MTPHDKLVDEINAIKRRRDFHLMDEPEYVEEILATVSKALDAVEPEKRSLVEPVTKRRVIEGDKVRIDLDADMKGSLAFIQDNGFNQAVEACVSARKGLLGQ